MYEANKLTISQRMGVITRPITLLYIDCKIAAKAIAKRLDASLPKLINNHQMGFIKGHYMYIGENIGLTINVVEYTKVHNISGILVSLGFQNDFLL